MELWGWLDLEPAACRNCWWPCERVNTIGDGVRKAFIKFSTARARSSVCAMAIPKAVLDCLERTFSLEKSDLASVPLSAGASMAMIGAYYFLQPLGDTLALSMGLEFTPLVTCLLYTSPSPRDRQKSRMPSSA